MCAKNIHIESKTYGYGVDMTSAYYLVKNGESMQGCSSLKGFIHLVVLTIS